MKIIAALLLLCVATFSLAAPAEQPEASANDQLAKLLFNDPDSPRLGAKAPRLTIVSFTDYNCPYCKQFDPMLEKIVHDNPDVLLIVKLLPFKGKVRSTPPKPRSLHGASVDKFWRCISG